MRNIATKHIEQGMQQAKPMSRAARHAWITGIGSITLYLLLYAYSDVILQMAKATLQGDKSLFFFPILIALGFSFVHGKFTGHFWDAMGLKAKQ